MLGPKGEFRRLIGDSSPGDGNNSSPACLGVEGSPMFLAVSPENDRDFFKYSAFMICFGPGSR